MTLHVPINYTKYLSEYEDTTNTSRFVIEMITYRPRFNQPASQNCEEKTDLKKIN